MARDFGLRSRRARNTLSKTTVHRTPGYKGKCDEPYVPEHVLAEKFGDELKRLPV